MNDCTERLLILLLCATGASAPVFAEEKSIYGRDNRLDFFAASAAMQKLSGSVVSLWDAKKAVLDPASKTYSLKTDKIGDKLNLCPGEKFREQPMGAFCSGSLVGEDLVMTAGHCITDETKCANTVVIFGFAVKAENAQASTTTAQGEAYTCSKIVKRFLGADPGSDSDSGLGPDYALIQLDRKVTGHTPLAVNRSSTTLKKGDGVFVIGHPIGLPLKVSGGATVRDTEQKGYFVADLDTFGGNSGSPVFNAKTKMIEGILVRGDEDFKQSPAGCITMATYAQDGGRGEDVTKMSALEDAIPRLAAEKSAETLLAAKAGRQIGSRDVKSMRGLDAKTLNFQ